MRPITALLSAAVLALAAAPGARAQSLGNDALHAEMLGPAILGSVNYERLMGPNLSGRVGLGYLPGFDIGATLQAPLMASVLLGRGVHRLEVGGGPVLVYAINRGIEEDASVRPGFRAPYAAATLAYRHEPGPGSDMHGGIYRIGLTPIYMDGRVYPSIGISAGVYIGAIGRR